MNHVCELNKVAKDVSDFSEKLATEIYEVSEQLDPVEVDIKIELNKVAKDVSDFSEKLAEALLASTGLINEGDKIVVVNALQNLYEGRIYVAGPEVEPGFILVYEESGSEVGIFKKERFQPYTRAF